MRDAYIIDGVRTPIGKFGGAFSAIRADTLAALVMTHLLARHHHIDPAAIDDVILGCANQAGEDNRNVARMALLLADLPYTVPGETVNRLCASGMSAVIHAVRAIQVEDGDLYIAGGVEQMTRAPFVLAKAPAAYSRSVEMYDTTLGWRFINPKMTAMYGTESMGETAENIAALWKISREEQDQFALWSQHKAKAARDRGRFAREILPVEIPRPKQAPLPVAHDEGIRADTSLDRLAALRPAFRDGGTVTAGNAAGISDGACVLLIASEQAMRAWHLTPRVRIVASAVVGVEPRIMGMGPVEATRRALKNTGLTLDDMAVIELHEAFAAQSLACLRELGIRDSEQRVNPNGGAIALGHPLGMSGARLLLTAAMELEDVQQRYALSTMCVGVGQGMATILERA